MDQATYNSNVLPYVEPFVTSRSYQYQVLLEDWAGNTTVVPSTRVLRMDNVDPTP